MRIPCESLGENFPGYCKGRWGLWLAFEFVVQGL